MASPTAVIALAFAVGCAWTQLVSAPPNPILLMAVIALCAVNRRTWRPLGLLLWAAAGAAIAAHQIEERRDHARSIGTVAGDSVEDRIAGVVVGPVMPTADGARLNVRMAGGAPIQVSVYWPEDPEPGSAMPLPGDRIGLWAPLRLPDPAGPGRRMAEARGIVARAGTSLDRIEVAPGPANLWRTATVARRALTAHLDRLAEGRAGSSMLRALVAGDRSELSVSARDRLTQSGAAHLIAVSGMHLAVVALVVFATVRRIWSLGPLAARVDPAVAGACGAAPVALSYTLVTGAAPATVRAAILVAIFLVAAASCRRARLSSGLGAAALITLAANPAALFDPGVQLSFVATATLGGALLGGQRPKGRWSQAVMWLRKSVLASLWTGAATAPIIAYHFGELPSGSVVANVFAVPLVAGCALPLGMLGLVIGWLWPPAGQLLIGAACTVLERVDVGLGRVAEWLPPAVVPLPNLIEVVVWSAGLIALMMAPRSTLLGRGRRLRRWGWLLMAVVAASWLWRIEIGPRLRSSLVVAFVDVGQGDAAVIELPGGVTWLIDAGGLPFTGGRDGERAVRAGQSPGRDVARYLASRAIDRIELAIISHPHPDHFRGLGWLVGRVDIDELWLAAGALNDRGELAAIVERLRARGTRVRSPPVGTVLKQSGVSLSILAPAPGPDGLATIEPVFSPNDNSLVARIDFAGRRLLFTGDLEEEGEQELIERHDRRELSADIVKVGHHGSATSSTRAFVDAIQPSYAVISCGRSNRFGFPAKSVVTSWRAIGAEVIRTDRNGTIVFVIASDGAMAVARAFSRRAGE